MFFKLHRIGNLKFLDNTKYLSLHKNNFKPAQMMEKSKTVDWKAFQVFHKIATMPSFSLIFFSVVSLALSLGSANCDVMQQKSRCHK